MITVKHTVLAAMLVGLALWTTAVVAPNSESRRIETFSRADRVNVFELMSNAKSLPIEYYEPF